MGERVIGPGLAREIAKAWLVGEFEGGRHANRVGKITDYEAKNSNFKGRGDLKMTENLYNEWKKEAEQLLTEFGQQVDLGERQIFVSVVALVK